MKAIQIPAILLALGLHVSVYAQGHSAHWIYGMGYHMEFVGETLVMHPRLDSFIAEEGANSISDKSGNLLYYSNTQRVWNANHGILLNSDSLGQRSTPDGGSTITTGVQFLPWPGDSMDRYYAMLLHGENSQLLTLSRIDRSLDGGLGGIEPAYKLREVSPHRIGEMMTAVRHGNGRDWWVISRRRLSSGAYTNAFLASLLTPEGIQETIVSDPGRGSLFAGELTASKDGSLLGLASADDGRSWVGVFSFDRCTGMATLIDSIRELQPNDVFYGMAFDAASETAYTTSVTNSHVYALTWPDNQLQAELVFSLDSGITTLPNSIGQLELGQDNRIHMPFMYNRLAILPNRFQNLTHHLGTITPDLPVGAQMDTVSVFLPDTINRTWSLPEFPNYDLGPLVGSDCDSLSPPVDTTSFIGLSAIEPLWSVHPTVSTGVFWLTELPIQARIAVYDGLGREVYRYILESEPTQLDLQHLPPGPYWVVARSREGAPLGLRRVMLQR